MIIACVYRTGGHYSPVWVDRLYAGVRANWNLTQPLQFVCLTDEAPWPAAYRIAPMTFKWPGWWSKIELFSPYGWFNCNTLYLDLDTIIDGPMRRVLMPMKNEDRGFKVMRDPNSGQLQSAAMRWTSSWMKEWGNEIFHAFNREPSVWMKEFSSSGDQGFINWSLEQMGRRCSFFGSDQVASYKAHYLPATERFHSTCVQFHGHPKPNELPEENMLRKQWIALNGV